MIIALDGPAGVGKSTLAKQIARDFGLVFLNSGAWYRAVAWKALEAGLQPGQEEDILDLAESLSFTLEKGELVVNGEPTAGRLHTAAVDGVVAQVSAIVPLRTLINTRIRNLSHRIGIVVEGRDMTTVAFPDAQVKFYIDASPEVRARRRFDERPEGESFEQVLRAIQERDHIDRTKPVGALKISPEAHYIDTSDLTFEQVYEKVKNTIRLYHSPGA